MDVYMYRAALYCTDCGEAIRERLSARAPADQDDESSYDSDDYPKGPFPDGGGEADCPQHCDSCNVFLENSLTSDGYEYVRDAVETGHDLHEDNGKLFVVWRDPVIKEWSEFYRISPGQDEST
jgi:hypothetical protein